MQKKPQSVLEIGSYDVNGNVRNIFTDYGAKYIGTDMRQGPNVDHVCISYDLCDKFIPNQFDCIVCLETLEHDIYFWKTLDVMKKLLNQNGYLIISTPTIKYPLHNHPDDFYRFTDSVYRQVFFNDMQIIDIQTLGVESHPCIAGIAKY